MPVGGQGLLSLALPSCHEGLLSRREDRAAEGSYRALRKSSQPTSPAHLGPRAQVTPTPVLQVLGLTWCKLNPRSLPYASGPCPFPKGAKSLELCIVLA